MVNYNTNDEYILNLYKDYNDLKQLIQDIKNLKEYLINNNICKRTKTYYYLDKPNYQGFKKLFNKLLDEDMINNDKLKKFSIYCQYYDQKFTYNLNGELIEKQITELKYQPTEIFIKNNDTLIFNCVIFNLLKEKIKKHIKALLTKTEINKTVDIIV